MSRAQKLTEVINCLEMIGLQEPGVQHIVKGGNIYDLNTAGDIDYGAFCVTQRTHEVRDGWVTFRFYLFIVDKLFEDGSNKMAVQSQSISSLVDILRKFDGDSKVSFDGVPDWYLNDEYEYEATMEIHPFTQRFASECAGAYCDFDISFKIDSTCSTDPIEYDKIR